MILELTLQTSVVLHAQRTSGGVSRACHARELMMTNLMEVEHEIKKRNNVIKIK